MTDHLWPMLRLSAGTDDDLIEKYREIYIENYVRDAGGNEIIIKDWNGNRVRFVPRSFNHAFSESSNYKLSAGVHNIGFSKERARRILWIREVLCASAGTIQRLHQRRKDSRGNEKKRRVLLVTEERYVVVLQENAKTGDLEFISAFPADRNYIQKIQRESALVETKMPQS